MDKETVIKELLEKLDAAQRALRKSLKGVTKPNFRSDIESILKDLRAQGWEQEKWEMHSERGNINYKKDCTCCYYREIKEGAGEECLFMDEECTKCGSHVLIEPRPKNWKPLRPF